MLITQISNQVLQQQLEHNCSITKRNSLIYSSFKNRSDNIKTLMVRMTTEFQNLSPTTSQRLLEHNLPQIDYASVAQASCKIQAILCIKCSTTPHRILNTIRNGLIYSIRS